MKKLIINNGKALADSTGKVLAIESDVTITSKGGWQGTTVPNSGYVENVYLNTNLSVDEVVSLLSQLTYNEGDMLLYGLLQTNEDTPLMLSIIKQEDVYLIMNFTDGFVYFHNSTNEEQNTEAGFSAGWNPNFDGIILVDSEVLSGDDTENYIGSQNELISSLFSTTPFVQASGESIGLSGEYDGSPIEVSENGNVDIKALIESGKLPLFIKVNVSGNSASGGTAVPNSGYVENVYFNTNLSVEEVVSLLSQLSYFDYGVSSQMTNILCVGDNESNLMSSKIVGQLSVENREDGYYVIYKEMDMETQGVVLNVPIFTGNEGWNSDFVGSIEINKYAYNTDGMNEIGSQNDKLSTLFSITPFN